MTRRILSGIALAVVVAAAGASAPSAATAVACGALTGVQISGVSIASAVEIAAGAFRAPGGGNAIDVPAFCRVVGVARPSPDSEVNFEVWIPPATAWNGKFQGVGNSAWTGLIPYGSMAAALRRGYATAATDTGHAGDDLTFALGHPEKIVDWAYRGIHVTTDAAKTVVRAHYGRPAERSYFTGCSTAGGQGLMAAQRYPADYDGIVATNPGGDRTNRVAGYIWSWQASHRTPANMLSEAKLAVLNQAATAACDGLDGVKDGVIDDPRRCRFDPGALTCGSEDTGACLAPAEVETARAIYQGPRNPKTGEQVFPGAPPGSETGWQTYYMNAPEPQRVNFWKYFVFNDASWDFHTFDLDRDVQTARTKMSIVNATKPDLRPFKARGGKLIVSAGWTDPIHLSEQAVQYYDSVERLMGGREHTADFYRLFMVPGMGHCAPGPGPSSFDALTELENWVERGIAPERMLASRLVNGKVERTRPLCPYPQVARWSGRGSTDLAANFSCVPSP